MVSLNQNDIDQIANLAKLNISTEESHILENKLNEILKFVEKINQVDTSNIEPLTYLSSESQPLREDVVTELNQRTLLQKSAPQVEAGLYMVPVVIEDE